MGKGYLCVILILAACYLVSEAEPNGVVLYRNGKRLGRHTVAPTAEHHYFGYLEGPAIENKYSAFRYYIDKDDRNAVDIIGKFKEEAILQHFSDSTVDEHKNWPWGTDILTLGSAIGVGAFRLFNNNSWINPQLPETLDSLVVVIMDSSVQTPKVAVNYYGWNVGGGTKINATWTIAATFDERPIQCELAISGDYSGKVVVGLVNHRDNSNNPNKSSVKLIQDESRAMLATLGKQGGLSEGFADTLLMAVFTEKNYFDSFVNQGTTNFGMVLKLDADKKAKWSMAYSWAREANPLFRNPAWMEVLAPLTDVRSTARQTSIPQVKSSGALYSLTGRLLGTATDFATYTRDRASGIVIRRQGCGAAVMLTTR